MTGLREVAVCLAGGWGVAWGPFCAQGGFGGPCSWRTAAVTWARGTEQPHGHAAAATCAHPSGAVGGNHRARGDREIFLTLTLKPSSHLNLLQCLCGGKGGQERPIFSCPIFSGRLGGWSTHPCLPPGGEGGGSTQGQHCWGRAEPKPQTLAPLPLPSHNSCPHGCRV